MNTTHEVTNQSTPLVDVNLFLANRPLRDALAVQVPDLRHRSPGRARRRGRLGRDAGRTRAWPTRTRRSCTRTTASATASTRSSSTPATTR